MKPLCLLDLFSGIGGFSLGLERSGAFRTVAFCEIEPFCQRVLAKHWPEVPIYDDVRNLTADALSRDGIGVDAICGGFPCQDISAAGKGAGIDGERSGLWSEYARIIGELRPKFVVVENVAAILGRGLDRVLGDLAALGFDAEWHCIPASAVGAHHRRDRIWIVAYPSCSERGAIDCSRGPIQWPNGVSPRKKSSSRPEGSGEALADTDEERCEGLRSIWGRGVAPQLRSGPFGRCGEGDGTDWWKSEPDLGRMAHGVSARMDRLAALGNAVVPQIPEMIGRAIGEAMRAA